MVLIHNLHFQVFVFMSYFNILSHTMSAMFVRGISEIAEALVAVKRLQQFMLYDEFEEIKALMNNNESKQDYKTAISLHKTIAKWNPNTTDVALDSITVSVEKGKLLGVIGPVGSGKSSFLQTILGVYYTYFFLLVFYLKRITFVVLSFFK